MNKKPTSAKERRQIGAAEAFIDARLAVGRVAFALTDLTKESGLSAIAAKYQLLRLRGKVARVSRRQPFFLIVGPEHRNMGAPPAAWWLQDYFAWLGRPYYLALQSAASSSGSNPQALQVTQVMTDRPCRTIKVGRISGGIEFNWPQHHRPATFLPVDFEIENCADGSKVIWCSDHDPMTRMKGMHGVCLHPGKAYLELKVRAYNRTPFVQTFLWWANVATRVHEGYQSFFPPDVYYVADHARRSMSEYPLARGFYYGVNYGERGQKGIPRSEVPKRAANPVFASAPTIGHFPQLLLRF